jgi:hypothetical protein
MNKMNHLQLCLGSREPFILLSIHDWGVLLVSAVGKELLLKDRWKAVDVLDGLALEFPLELMEKGPKAP